MSVDTTLAPERYLALIRADAERMADLAPRDLAAPVPTCPGWTAGEALLHTGEVYSHKVACMRLPDGPQDQSDWSHGPEADQSEQAWFRARLAELLTELELRGPDAPSHTWHRDHKTVRFWFRRMAQETAVHRVDVESAFGDVSPVDEALAVDGIDEVLDWFLRHDDEGDNSGLGAGVVAVRTGDRIWLVTLRADGIELSREPGHADAVVYGEPSELLLWLWGRRPDTAVRWDGDDRLVRALRERLRIVTQ